MTATVHDVARKAGVSQITVSRAFSGKLPVAESTRNRILKAAEQLGYHPNALARGLRGAGTSSIGVIWAFADPWAGDAIIALDLLERLQGREYAVYQSQDNEDAAVLCRQIDDLLRRRVEALVIRATPTQLRDPQVKRRLKAAPAVVAVSREDLPEFEGDLLVHDRSQAIRQVVDHFADAGRRRPAIALSLEQEASPPKFKAFADRCRERGIADHPHLVIDTSYPMTPEDTGERFREGLRRAFGQAGPIPVDAILCFNDDGALYIMRELQDRGLRVPEDVAVVGFNNIQAGQVWRPALATGDRKPREVATAIDRMLMRRLEQADLPPQRETIPMSFIWRASAGGPASPDTKNPDSTLSPI